jgi:hypothetical protein
MAGVTGRIRALLARRSAGREARRAAKLERAQKKARAEALRLEYRRDVGASGADAMTSVRRSERAD